MTKQKLFPILSDCEPELEFKKNKFRKSKRIYKKNKKLLNLLNNHNIKNNCKKWDNLSSYNKKQFLLKLKFFEVRWNDISGNLKIYNDKNELIINHKGKITQLVLNKLNKKVKELEKNNIFLSDVDKSPMITGNVKISGINFPTDFVINGWDNKYVTLSTD